MSDETKYSIGEAIALFEALFPNGFQGPDVLSELAPDGWENSPWIRVFHPSVEQLYHEALFFHNRLTETFSNTKKKRQEPSYKKIEKEHKPAPLNAVKELSEIIASSLWDIFSDNHSVIDHNGIEIDIGSFRGAADFLADLLNSQLGTSEYNYMSFYMGTAWLKKRADFTPVYIFIFTRMRFLGLDWKYSIPQFGMVKFTHNENYISEMEQKIDEINMEMAEEITANPPPDTVKAYYEVYGSYPNGWPLFR